MAAAAQREISCNGMAHPCKKLNEERSDPSSELYFKKQHPDAKKIDVVSYVTVKRAMEGEK